MILKIPFYKNDELGVQCMQVAMKTALKYFLDKDYELDELDKLTGRKGNYAIYTSQIVTVLHDLGLAVKFYSKESLEPYLGGESFIRGHFGKDAENILKVTDIPVVVDSIKKLLDYDIFEKKIISIEDIKENISKGYVVMVLIDYNKIMGREGFYQGHFVIVTGFEADNIYFHESGSNDAQLNRKISAEIFINAMNANGTDNDCVIVSGKR